MTSIAVFRLGGISNAIIGKSFLENLEQTLHEQTKII